MTTVADVLNSKGREIFTASLSTTVYLALKKMVEKKAGALMVTHEGEVVGIITERDYLKNVVLGNRAARATPVSDVMTSKVVHVEPATTLASCMWIMTEQRCRHLLVVDHEGPCGVISSSDIMRRLSKDQDATIQSLTVYINQPYPG